jgi:hypothetical protein
VGPSWGLSWPHVGLKLIYAGGEKCRKTPCFELFSKLSARRGGLNWPHVGGVNWLTLRPKLASCWFILGAEKCGKTQCFELFSKLWLVT